MTPPLILSAATSLALAILAVALLLTVWRVIRGPTLADRVVALDMLVAVAIGFIAVFAVRTGFNLYVDIAIALGLVGFLATVAFARFILSRAPPDRPPAEVAGSAKRLTKRKDRAKQKEPKKKQRKGRS